MEIDFDTSLLPTDHINFTAPFLQILGKVHFIKHWRADISVAHAKLSHFQAHWSEYHWKALIRVCRYLYCTKDYGMFFTHSPTWVPSETECITLSDAELATNKANRHSLVGHVLWIEGNLISFKTQTTRCVVTDIAYSELIAMHKAVKRMLFIFNIFVSLVPFFLKLPLMLYGDNLSALWMTRNKSNSTKTKHYDLKYQFVTEKVLEKKIKTGHVESVDNASDFLTKIQSVSLFLEQRAYFVAETVDQLKKFVTPKFDKSDLDRARDQ